MMGGGKGNLVLDGIIVIVVLFTLGITIIVGYLVLSDFNDDFQNDTSIPEIARNTTRDNVAQYQSGWDGAFLFLMVLFWILTIIASFLIDSHPVFFVLALLMLGLVLIFAAQMSNAFEEFTDDADITAAAAGFPYMLWIFDHLVIVIMGMAFSIAIALYAKIRGAGG